MKQESVFCPVNLALHPISPQPLALEGALLRDLAFTGLGIWGLSKATQIVRRKPFATMAALTAIAGVAALSRRPTLSYRDRTIIISGGSRGLGLALARQFLLEGARVAILARDRRELEDAAIDLGNLSADVLAIPCDVTNQEQLSKAFSDVREHFGRFDVVVHNAGSIAVGANELLNDEDFEAQLKLHLHAARHSAELAIPEFRRLGGGQIINISSIGGQLALPHMAAYSASKFALGGWSETLAAELRAEGILVSTVYPGLMRTGSPIQGVFKGDAENEFTWFAAADNAPLLSIPADTAARQIVAHAKAGRSEIVVPARMRIAIAVRHLLPGLWSAFAAITASVLPKGASTERKTGAQVDGNFESSQWMLPLRWRARAAERAFNQRRKTDPDFNMGTGAAARFDP